jgi:hypothetical protein
MTYIESDEAWAAAGGPDAGPRLVVTFPSVNTDFPTGDPSSFDFIDTAAEGPGFVVQMARPSDAGSFSLASLMASANVQAGNEITSAFPLSGTLTVSSITAPCGKEDLGACVTFSGSISIDFVDGGSGPWLFGTAPLSYGEVPVPPLCSSGEGGG